MHLLSFTNFQKKYDQHLVLDVPALEMPLGMHVVVGANGSGKSTLLKVLAGLIPYKGEIQLLEDIDLIKDRMQHRRIVSYCAAEPDFPSFLVGQYLVDMYVNHKGKVESQVEQLCQLLKIEDFLQQKIGSYSSGMKKKLALLLAFIGNPSLILLDEPFNTLDTDAQLGLVEAIRQYQAEGVHFLMASHQPLPVADLPIVAYWRVGAGELHHSTQTEASHWLAELEQ